MTVGYARVSTTSQHLDMQLDALAASGCTRIHTDTASGALAARPGLDRALAELDEGDTLVVWRLDRFGRSLPHLVATIDNLTKRGVNLKSLHEAIDTTTRRSRRCPAGRRRHRHSGRPRSRHQPSHRLPARQPARYSEAGRCALRRKRVCGIT